MTAKEILEELDRLPPEERLSIARALLRGLGEGWRPHGQENLTDLENQELAGAAGALLADYLGDTELTAFCALDGEGFHAQG